MLKRIYFFLSGELLALLNMIENPIKTLKRDHAKLQTNLYHAVKAYEVGKGTLEVIKQTSIDYRDKIKKLDIDIARKVTIKKDEDAIALLMEKDRVQGYLEINDRNIEIETENLDLAYKRIKQIEVSITEFENRIELIQLKQSINKTNRSLNTIFRGSNIAMPGSIKEIETSINKDTCRLRGENNAILMLSDSLSSSEEARARAREVRLLLLPKRLAACGPSGSWYRRPSSRDRV